MSKKEELNIIDETEFIKLAHHSEKDMDVILVKSDEELSNFKYFKSINFFGSEIDGDKYILLAMEVPSNDVTPLYDLIVSNFDGSLFDTLNKLKKIFESESSTEDYLKFRGDYAEALFMFKNKGSIKLPETETADIAFETNMYEIKSFSPSKKTITISLKQILENSIKIAIPLIIDNDGKTIIFLADNISDRIFSEYLISEYENSKYAVVKYEQAEFMDVSNAMPSLKLPDNVLEADFVIDIKDEIE